MGCLTMNPLDRYLLDAASGGTFMTKYEDDAMEPIKRVAENSHHNTAKPFGRGAMTKTIDAKFAKTGMLLERIDKMTEFQNLLLDRLNIRNGSKGPAPVSLQEALPCANCSRFDHMELDCPVMAIQGQNKGHQEDRLNRDDKIFWVHTLTIIIPLFLRILHRIHDLGGTTINLILHNTTVSNNNNLTLIKDIRRSSRQLNHKSTRKLHARLRRHPIRSSAQSHN